MAPCCKSIIGCRFCTDEWFENSLQCKDLNAKDDSFEIFGMGETLEALRCLSWPHKTQTLINAMFCYMIAGVLLETYIFLSI